MNFSRVRLKQRAFPGINFNECSLRGRAKSQRPRTKGRCLRAKT
jgi:hypothetical protein